MTVIVRPSALHVFFSLTGLQRHRCYSSARTSVNPNEISHFDRLAASWWDPYGSSRLLHQMNPLRHRFIQSCQNAGPANVPRGKRRYLDIGCGGGIFAESAARLLQTECVLGIDPSNEVVSVARRHACLDAQLLQSGRLEYRNQSIESMPLPRMPSEMFDVVALFEVIEHIDQPAPFLYSCLPFVRPGGWLILSTIARTWTSWLTTKLVAEDVIGLVPKGTHEWERYVNERELVNIFQNQTGWGKHDGMKCQGCIYIPGMGWQFVTGGEKWGNYFFGIRRDMD